MDDEICPDCLKPSDDGRRCDDCKDAFDRACSRLNSDLNDDPPNPYEEH